MYDWPEVRTATDALWAAVRDGIRRAGLEAPQLLCRGDDPMALWTDPRLVLGQTCGLPFVHRLRGRVALLGAPDFGVPGCAPGWYRSAVIVRADDPRGSLSEFEGARFAANERGSQSGWAAMAHHVAALTANPAFFGAIRMTGSHVASATSIAGGDADIAAIDYVSWRLIRRFRPETGGLRVLMLTGPTPGLPYVTALTDHAETLSRVVGAAIAGLDRPFLEALGMRSFARIAEAEYDLIRDRDEAARGRGM